MSYTGWTVLPLFCLLSTVCCMPDGDLCRWMNGRKYYIDVGESGIISAENVTNQAPPPPVIGLKGSLSGNETSGSHPQIPQRCSVELITCPSCHFRVTVLRMNIPPCSADGSCRCDFVWVKEAAYSKSGQEFCGQKKTNETASLNFESKTKLVSVDFLYTGAYLDAFALQFSAIKNVYVHKGGYNYYQPNSTGVITSPNFPGGYPSDYSAEYILQNVDTTGYVQLLFTDFQLSLWSYMEILDSNGSRIDVYNGNTFRPPALISSGPIMTVKFQANEEYPSSGFRAIYTFVSYAEKYWINRPSTDCGGFVEDYGGAITMMNMVPGNVMRAYDCIWLIRPQNAVIPGMQISVRVAQFEEMGSKSTLTIRKGLYSEASIVESITPYQQHKLHRGQEYVVHANIGFYIRLIGYFNNRSHLAIIYSTFRYEGCYAVGDFECENGRCIKNALRCDGFNHCGDGSDEASCYGANQGTPSPEDANWWRTLTPNYYFPKSDGGSNAGTNTLILVTSLAGLGMFVLTTIVILVKLHKQRQDDSISREILQTISADIEAENAQYTQAPPSDPPMYDPPPSYEDVIKYYLPPPPAYSSVNRTRANNPRTGPAANEQAERSVNIRGRGRRTRGPKHRNATLHEALEPVILRVSLPAEDRNLVSTDTVPSSSDARTSPSTSTASSNAMVQSSRSTIKQSNSPNENLTQQVHSSLSAVDQNKAMTRKTSPIKTIRKCSRLLRATTKSVNCDCHGACSCSLQKVYAQNENTDSQPKTSFGLQSHPYTNEGYSCNETTHTLNNKKSLSIPFISPSEVVTVTIRPSRSKSFVNESKQVISKSAGPSSPSACHSDTLDSSNRLTHRRSSSGPSEIFCTFDQDSNSTSVTNSPKSVSLNKVNNNATTASPGSSTDTAGSANKSDKNILPLGWGTLWNPVRRRSDRDETLKTKTETELWQQSDRQPLLTQRSPKTENLSHLQNHEKENQTSQTNKNTP